jgi:hypothetical protein
VLVTYEGMVLTTSGTWEAAEGIIASSLYVENRNGLLSPALLPLPAQAGRTGLVLQAANVGYTWPSPQDTAELWQVLYDLEAAMAAAGWMVEDL